MARSEKVFLVGHKDSARKKDYLAIAKERTEAERLLTALPGATFIKEVTYESR